MEDLPEENRRRLEELPEENRRRLEELPEENRRLLEERNKPKLTLSMTGRQRKGSRTFSMAGSRSCTTLPQGAGSGLQRAAGDHFDPHTEEGTKEEKRAL